ncbi:serine/threonine protein kinase [Streptomyces fungicidicus]|uniref:serine/threonine-protein kinase n=1 Tax=Streptomyces fungicidicus TaxID=68203 RepID=UPI0033F0F271
MIELGGSGAEPLEDEDPRRIGPVPLIGRLGAGGMGRVYLGVHEGRYAAVKQLLPSVVAEDKDFLRRFGHELDNLARLPEDATAPLLAGDRTARPPWFATAYVPGLTLREALEAHEGPLPTAALWLLLREAASGLAAVHALDMVHRDIKPSNVMLTLEGLTLIDFGVARAAEQSQLTRTGMVVGTPAYMSPEQASGARRSTGAVDVFALGSVLAYAASGRPPFGDESGHGVLYRIVHEDPDLDAVRALDPELAEVVAACLDKDYEGRPTAAELVELAERHGPFAPPLWPEAVTARLAERAAFAATTPVVPDVQDVPEEPERPGEPEAAPEAAPEKRERRTRVVPVIVPVVVVATGATLAFTLLPYTFDASDDAGPSPSASVTVSADATPSGTAGGSAEPSPSTSASPSKDSKEKDSRKQGSQESPTAAAPDTDDEAAKGGSGGGGGDGGGSAPDTGPGTDTEADAPSTGGSTLRNARSGQCLISYGGAGYGNVATGDCASGAADWSLRSASSGTYRIVHRESGNCLSAYGAMHSGTCGADDAQTWRIGSGGTVVLVKTGRCLEHTQGGGTIMARVCDGSASQNWTRS